MCWPFSSIVDNVQFGTGQTVGIVALFWRMFEFILFFKNALFVLLECFCKLYFVFGGGW